MTDDVMNTRLPEGLRLLELGPDASVQDVRRAYARRVKVIDQTEDPGAFQALRTAYEDVLAWCERRESDDAPTVALLAADEVAQQALHGFLSAGLPDAETVSDRLQALLDGAPLQAIEVRQHFERMLVRQLAGGWQPGHEHLFEAAVVALAWDLEPDRLRAYGAPGAVVCEAVEDRDRFEEYMTVGRAVQLDLMDRIRTGRRPSDTDLVRTFRVLDWLMANYGQWMVITVGSRNVAQWDGWHDELPRDRHSADAPHPEPTHAPEWLGLPDKDTALVRSPLMRGVRGAAMLLASLFVLLWVWGWLSATR